MKPTAPVYGLILAGGASTRMQRDKAALLYRGQSQLDRVFELLKPHVAQIFVSVRADQTADAARANKPLIVDSLDGAGPIVGILSALAQYPHAAWLVLACDLPFLSEATLQHLVAARDASAFATAYRSAHDGLPEPLCAIWEPAAAAALAEYQVGGGRCPRKFLIRHAVQLLTLVEPSALDNVNTPEEYARALTTLEPLDTPKTARQTTSMQLNIQYYALLREQAGRSAESIQTSAATPQDLYSELRVRFGFTLLPEQLKVAVNSEFSEWSRELINGDSVVFIPPVAGG